MNKNLILGIIIGLFSTQIYAASFGIFDARSLAMGGTGVASGDASNASYYNPALLATTNDNDDFSLVIPTIAVGIADPDNLADALDTYTNANYESTLDSAVTSYNSAATPTTLSSTATSVAAASQALLDGINTLSNKSIVLNANAGVLLAIPSKSLGISVYSAARVVGGTNLNVTAADTQAVQAYITVLACIGAIDPNLATTNPAQYAADFQACDNNVPSTDVINDATGDFNNTDIAGSLSSTVNVRGAIISETGVSFAHKFNSLSGLSVGITPKTMKVDTFDSGIGLTNATLDIDSGRKSYSDSNFDIGLAMNLTDYVKVGFVAKNMISKQYKTILNNTVDVKPQYRAGVAFQNDWVLVSADIDLTKNAGVGFENDTKYIALGVEFDLFDTLQARAGYRQNTANNNSAIDKNVSSLGIGFSPFGTHFDLAVAQSASGIEAGFQFGVKF